MTLSTAEKKSETFMNNNICPQNTQSDLIRFVFKNVHFKDTRAVGIYCSSLTTNSKFKDQLSLDTSISTVCQLIDIFQNCKSMDLIINTRR